MMVKLGFEEYIALMRSSGKGKAFLAGTACAKVTKGESTSEAGVARGQVSEHVVGHVEEFGL